MVGRLFSFWDGLFSGAMLDFQGFFKYFSSCFLLIWRNIWSIESGQIIIYHQPRFPWKKGIPLFKTLPFGGPGRVRSRANLTKSNVIYLFRFYLFCFISEGDDFPWNVCRGYPSKTMEKSGENLRFFHVFHGAFVVFSLKFDRGYPTKIAGTWEGFLFFSVFHWKTNAFFQQFL